MNTKEAKKIAQVYLTIARSNDWHWEYSLTPGLDNGTGIPDTKYPVNTFDYNQTITAISKDDPSEYRTLYLLNGIVTGFQDHRYDWHNNREIVLNAVLFPMNVYQIESRYYSLTH